jgi:epoxyqueuosine reductase QueG
MPSVSLSKSDIVAQARALGAELVGLAPIDRWNDLAEVPANRRPQAIWPRTRTVIVLGVPLWLPVVEAAPSQLGREQIIVTDKLLEEAAYRLSVFLNERGHAAINVPRNSEDEPDSPDEVPRVFSHVWAGQLAGLGKVGRSRALLTRGFGPRQRLISVFTALPLDGDALVEAPLCTRCGNCERICPAHALSTSPGQWLATVDASACATNHKRLRAAFRDPCGFCHKVCPVGEDRALFGSTDTQKYFDEAAVLAQNPFAPQYQDWLHIRKYGGLPLPEDPTSIR